MSATDIITQRTSSTRLRRTPFFIALVIIASCKQSGQASGEVSRNWMPQQQQQYMGVPAPAAQAAIQQRLNAGAPGSVSDDEWKHVKKLYATFNRSLLWLDGKGVHQPRVSALLNSLANADSEALRLDAFPLSGLSQSLAAVDKNDHPTAAQLADADVLLSSAFVAFSERTLTGQEKPAQLAQSWHINPMEERVDSALALTLRTDDLQAGLTRMRPQDPGYDGLRTQLGVYRQIVSGGGWPSVPAGKALKRGDSDSPTRLEALRARLRMEGFLSDSGAAVATSNGEVTSSDSGSASATSTKARAARAAAARASRSGPGIYDRTLADAVSRFQTRHNIPVDGMLGNETLDALNLPATYRLAQIAANMERYRWMPRSLGMRYIMVNVPEFKLIAFDDGQKALEMKTIVGKDYEDKATPVFSDSMEYVIFRPYWNVTPAIAAKEIFPLEQAHPGYFDANDMEVYSDHGRQAVRQRPGPKNALGYVKFMFPNDFNIYLHDTPNHELFKKDVRAFSHGCIRLEKPAELAQWVLGWSPDKVDEAMHGADNHQVNLPKKIPVYIVYFTAYVDDGALNFGNDLYDRDSRLVQQIAGTAQDSPETIQAQTALRALAK